MWTLFRVKYYNSLEFKGFSTGVNPCQPVKSVFKKGTRI